MLLKNNRRLIITLQRQLNGWWIIEWDKGLKWDPIQLVDDVSFHLEPRGAVFYKQILVETALSFEGHFIASWKSNGSQTKNNAWVLQCTYHCNVICLSELWTARTRLLHGTANLQTHILGRQLWLKICSGSFMILVHGSLEKIVAISLTIMAPRWIGVWYQDTVHSS